MSDLLYFSFLNINSDDFGQIVFLFSFFYSLKFHNFPTNCINYFFLFYFLKKVIQNNISVD